MREHNENTKIEMADREIGIVEDNIGQLRARCSEWHPNRLRNLSIGLCLSLIAPYGKRHSSAVIREALNSDQLGRIGTRSNGSH